MISCARAAGMGRKAMRVLVIESCIARWYSFAGLDGELGRLANGSLIKYSSV